MKSLTAKSAASSPSGKADAKANRHGFSRKERQRNPGKAKGKMPNSGGSRKDRPEAISLQASREHSRKLFSAKHRDSGAALNSPEGSAASPAARASSSGYSRSSSRDGKEGTDPHPARERGRDREKRKIEGDGPHAQTNPSTPTNAASRPQSRHHPRKGERNATASPARRPQGYAAPKTEEERAAERKRSVFVSNLPPDASKEELDSIFQSFGAVATTKLVGASTEQQDKDGKGITRSAFVIFKEQASAERALAACAASPLQKGAAKNASASASGNDENRVLPASASSLPLRGMSVFAAEALGVPRQAQTETEQDLCAGKKTAFVLRGQRLLVRPVLAREEAEKLKGQKGQWNRKEDSASRRRLHLAFEGMISPKSAAFDELPPPEQRRRLQAWQEKKEKMKNPNYFVNPTRLSVRNLPTSASANDLRETMSHFLVKSAEFAQFESSRMVQREAERDARERREGRGTAKPSDAEGEDSGLKPRRVTQFSLLHPKQQRRLAEQAIVKVRIIRDKERRRASSPYLPLSWKESGSATAKEKRSLGFAFVDCAHAEVAKILLNFLGSCTSRDFLPENLAAQKDAGEETEDEERPRHGRSMWRRLMVEYAMEDARKVKLKEEKNRAYVQMLERQKKKNQEGEEGSQPPSSAKPSLPKKLKTYSRGKRQRERRRQARLAAAGVGESQSLLNGIENEKTFEKKEASQSASEANKKHVNDESKRTEGKKRKISREADESSAAEDEILVFDEEGEANAPRVFPKRIKSHADSRRRRKQQHRSKQENANLEEEYLKNRVQFLLSNQG